MKIFIRYLPKYLNWILFFIFLIFLLFYLDKKTMLFLESIKLTYFDYYSYLKFVSRFVENFYKIFVVIVSSWGLYTFFSKTKKEEGRKIISGIVIVGLLSQVKYLLGRARPKITYETIFTGPSTKYLYASFPSGHTFFVFALAKILSHCYPKYKILFYFFAVLVGLERLLNFAHFPSDIVAGAFLGMYTGKIITLKITPKIIT